MALDGKRILVTGGAGGLGKALVPLLLARGAWVAVTYRSNEHLAELLAAVGPDGPQPVALSVELTDPDSVARVAEDVPGDLPFDGIACLAGGWQGGAPAWESPAGQLDEQLAMNVLTVWNVVRAFVPAMVAAGRGRVVTVGARAAERPQRNQAAFTAAKAAVAGLTRALAEDLRGTGVTAACLLPSAIGAVPAGVHHGVTPVPPLEVAEAVAWLLDDEAAVVDGAAIPVYGGR